MTQGARGQTVPAPAYAPDGAVGTGLAVEPCALTKVVRTYDPKADTGLIEAAYALATAAHGAQKRDNGDPYITHPLAVAEILAGYRLDTASIVTGLLHDVIEDTPVKLPEIGQRFGKTVAGLVDGVTKLTRLELQSDRTKQAENFRKLVLAISRDIRVLLVKLADRLHNMRTLHFVQDPERRKRIARETMEIYAPLAERIGMESGEGPSCRTLAFAQLELGGARHDPGAPQLPARAGRGRHRGGSPTELTRVCERRPVCGADGDHRAREVDLLDLGEDAAAQRRLRAALRHHGVPRRRPHARRRATRRLGPCIHAAYPVIAGRFKDYISTPKSNGYQSIHTGVTLARAAQPEDRDPDTHRPRCMTLPRTASRRTGATSRTTPTPTDMLQRFRWVLRPA